MAFLPSAKTSTITSLLWVIIFAIFSPLSYSGESDNNTQNELDALLAKHKGKVIYIDFWASWCGPCRKSFPWMNKVQSSYNSDQFTVISINLDNEKTLAETFLQSTPANFPVIYDPKGTLAKKFKVKGMPSSYLINQDGKVIKRHTGFFSAKITNYEQEIDQLIASSPNNLATM